MRLAIALVVAGLAGCTPAETQQPMRPPRPPSCVQVADHVPELVDLDTARERRVRDLFHARCSQDRWSPDVRTCIVATRSFFEPRRCKAKLTASQRTAFDRELAIALKAGDARRRVPAECAEYGSMVERIAGCDAMSRAARDALQQAYRDAAQAWAALTEEQLAEAATGCKAAGDAIKQLGTGACGW